VSTEVSSVRISRLRDGHTWSVTVAASDDSVEALEAAKERALGLTRQLESELGVELAKKKQELPF
jgi:hypothetical protein